MKIRNLRKYDLYFPYAGQKRGMLVKAGQLSMDLPTDRFYDPLLQRDWRAGKIEVLLTEMDKTLLGPVLQQFKSEPVEVDASPAPAPAPEPVAPQLEPAAATLKPDGDQIVLPPPPPKPPVLIHKPIGKDTRPSAAPAAAIHQRADSIKVHVLAAKLGVQSKAVLVVLRKLGMKAGSANMYVTLQQAEEIKKHFLPEYRGSPALDPALTSAGPHVPRLHEVPDNVPGAPSVAAAPGAPGLEDLVRANARLRLGTPNFASSKPNASGVQIQPLGGSMFGSTLSEGVPQKPATGGDE